MTTIAAEKHAQFVKARKGHYSKEAEAMKVRWSLKLDLGPTVDINCFSSLRC
jgi:hypothetical protein